MENKLCLVTGANSGIGKATAISLADMGAYVVILCRDEEKAERAKEVIVSKTRNAGVEILLADFANPYEIREAVKRLTNKFNKLDVLVNNAGMLPSQREETPNGIEKTFAVNHLGPFLLTNLLLEALKTAPQGRVVNVSSEAHRLGAPVFDPENLQLEEGYSPMKAYGLSKLCNIMFTHELAKRIEPTNITVNALHPGVVNTNLAHDASWIMKLLYTVGKPFMRSPRKGAQTSVHLAASPEVSHVSGKYFKNKKIATPAAEAYDDALTAKLWDISEKLTNLD